MEQEVNQTEPVLDRPVFIEAMRVCEESNIVLSMSGEMNQIMQYTHPCLTGQYIQFDVKLSNTIEFQ